MAKKKPARTTRKKSGGPRRASAREKPARRAGTKKAVAGRSASGPVKARAAAPRRAGPKKGGRKAARNTAAEVAATAVAVDSASLAAADASHGEAPAKRPTKLNKKELEQFRQLLLQKRAELVGDVDTLQSEALSANRRDAAGDLSSMPIHMADLGTDNYEKEFTLGLIEGERALLREIDQALARIESGTYGICEATGKPIGKARLRATPWAKFCYEYVLAQEKGQPSEGS